MVSLEVQLCDLYDKSTFNSDVDGKLLVKISHALRHCECDRNQCVRVKATWVGIHNDEVLHMKCSRSTCKNAWLICVKCLRESGTQRQPMGSIQKYKKHFQNCHQNIGKPKGKKRKTREENSTNEAKTLSASPIHCERELRSEQRQSEDCGSFSEDEIAMPISADDGELINALLEPHWLYADFSSNDLGFSGKRNVRFFQEQHDGESRFAGMQYLALRFVRKQDFHPSETLSRLAPVSVEDATMIGRTAKLSYTILPYQKELLAQIISMTFMTGVRTGYKNGTALVGTSISSWLQCQGHNIHELDNNPRYIESEIAPKFNQVVDQAAFAPDCRIPRTPNEIRNGLLEGEHSIISNLPTPPIHLDVSGHSYALVSDCIRDFFGHCQNDQLALIKDTGSPVLNVNHPSQSKLAKDIFDFLSHKEAEASFPVPTAKGYLFMWSDDAEPNKLSKAGRGSFWILTLTIGTVLGNGHNLNHTYPLAIAKKGANHDSVLAKIEEDMKQVRNGMAYYIGSKKKKGIFQFTEFAHLGDQPERRGLNYLKLGVAIFAARFGVSANHKSCYSVLLACRRCASVTQERLEERETSLPLPECSKCLNWDVLKDSNLALGPPPQNYPLLSNDEGNDAFYAESDYCRLVRRVLPDGRVMQLLKPFRLSFDGLNGAIELAHRAYCHHGWTAANVSAYLDVENLNDAFITDFQRHAANAYALASVRNGNQNTTPELRQAIEEDAAKNPAAYEMIALPATFTREGFGLDKWPNVIMHLMFLGMVKTVSRVTEKFLKVTRRSSAFRKANAAYLDPLTTMSIEWLNIMKYSGELGHWVSENYHGFARLMPWFYQNIVDLEVEPEIILGPETEQSKWPAQHNRIWLKRRGLDTKGKAEDLRVRVANYMSSDEVPPLLNEPDRPIVLVERVVLTLHEFVACVMAPTVTEELACRTDYAVRAFLTAYDNLDACLTTGQNFILNKPNFGCLIDLPDMMRKYGPLRELWEGGPRGEGFLKFAKPHMKQGFRHQNWHYHLHRKLLNTKALDNCLPKEEHKREAVNSLGALTSRRGQFYPFKSEASVMSAIRQTRLSEKQPISVIFVKDSKLVKIYAVLKEYKILVLIRREDNTPEHRFGFHYYHFDAPDDSYCTWESIALSTVAIGFGILLPILEESNGNTKHALISSNWKSLKPGVCMNDLIDMTKDATI